MRYTYLLLFAAFFSYSLSAQNPKRLAQPTSKIYLELQQLAKPVRVLYVAAHPDDENTRVISWLENARNVETAYFSFTRGDGGQNLIGNEKGPLLGVLRTQELLEARKKDGARQFFSHAVDFGYSKSIDETLEIWNKDQVLGDLVYVLRYFKPDVVITRFPPTRAAGHGHHAASAALAKEAYDLAGDPTQFPAQLQRVSTWKPHRLMWNSYSWRRDPKLLAEDVKINVGQSVPLLGAASSEIASQARSMHRCQGFGRSWNRGEVNEYFKHTAGANFYSDILEGINVSWSRFDGGAPVDAAFQKAMRNFSFTEAWKNIPALAAIKKALLDVPSNTYVDDALKKIDDLILACAQANIELYTDEKAVVAGDSLQVTIDAVAMEPIGAALKSVVFEKSTPLEFNQAIGNNIDFTKAVRIKIPSDKKTATPYWLENESSFGSYQFEGLQYLEKPESEPSISAKVTVDILGNEITFNQPVFHKRVEPDYGEKYEPLPVLTAVSVNPAMALHIAVDQKPTPIQVTVTNHSKVNQQRSLGITLPKGWQADKNELDLKLEAGESQRIAIALQANEDAQPGSLKFYWSNSEEPVIEKQTVDYPHILKQTIQTGALVNLRPVNVQSHKLKIGYIPGAGDDIPEILGNLGYTVVEINASNFDFMDLSDFHTIITGIRAYNTQEWLAKKAEKIWEYAKNGGNVVVQYNTLNFLSEIKAPIAPENLQIGRDRVTKEEAPITILAPKHPVLNVPNRITAVDFEEWVQERGLYFASEWSPAFTPIFEIADPGEDPSQGSLLVGSFGKGHISYCGISFFRQLPAGVPGAYRLFVNLVELGYNG